MKNFFKNIDWSNISTGTEVRTVVLLLAFVNQILTVLHLNFFGLEDDVYGLLSTIVTIVASIMSWWKNNSVTTQAIQADAYMVDLKTDN